MRRLQSMSRGAEQGPVFTATCSARQPACRTAATAAEALATANRLKPALLSRNINQSTLHICRYMKYSDIWNTYIEHYQHRYSCTYYIWWWNRRACLHEFISTDYMQLLLWRFHQVAIRKNQTRHTVPWKSMRWPVLQEAYHIKGDPRGICIHHHYYLSIIITV